MIMAAAILLFTTTATAAPFQWGGNGRFVSLMTAEENDFVRNLLNENLGEGTRASSSWLIGYHTDPTDKPFGPWAWVRGEEWSYEHRNPNIPNNDIGGIQQYPHHWGTLAGERSGMDNRRHRGGQIVEFGPASDQTGTSPVPTHAMMSLTTFPYTSVKRKFRPA